jgi:hypothetical protein
MDFEGRHFGSFRHNRVNIPIHWTQDRFGDFDQTQSAGRLERLAEVRSAVVARGRSLIANPNYPDQEIVRKVGRLLAEHIRH